MVYALNNLANAVTSDATNFTNLTIAKSNPEEQLKLSLAQNKVLIDLLRKIYAVLQKFIQKTRIQINYNALIRYGGMGIE